MKAVMRTLEHFGGAFFFSTFLRHLQFFYTPYISASAVRCDPPWTPGQWRPSSESSSSGNEEKEENKLPVDHVLDAYNGAMGQIAGLSKDASVEQLTFRMKVE